MKGDDMKLTKSNMSRLVESGTATRFGDDWPGKRCLAKTRSGTPCQKAAIKGKDRCQLHGGRTPCSNKATTKTQSFHSQIQAIKRWAEQNGYTI